MKRRCDSGLARYGGRGISYCDRWKKFENFFADMGRRPGPNYTVERENNNGNYEPSNCVWADRQTQNNNTSANHMITIGDRTDTLANWCRFYGLIYGTVNMRIYKLKWEPERAITAPIRQTKRRKL